LADRVVEPYLLRLQQDWSGIQAGGGIMRVQSVFGQILVKN
jgi:hypothetical protein